MEPEPNALYADPSIYDILHASGTADDVNALERIEACFCAGATGTWLEPACGSGRYLRLAVRRGKSVVGFDLEEHMIAYAKDIAERRNTTDQQQLFVADMRSFAEHIAPGSIGLAFNLINTIRHLETDEDLIQHFAEIAKCLDTNGVYAVGISLTAYGLEMPSEDVWTGKRGTCEVMQVINYLPPADESDRSEQIYSHLTVTRPSGEEHIPSSYTLRTYNESQWRDVIDRSALRVLGVVDMLGEPAEPEEPGYAIWVLAPR
ncbi:MAG: class I SAM-dependent methyltransferase [Phycisphaerales bacterium JB061]